MKAYLPGSLAEVSALTHRPALMKPATISVGSRSNAVMYIGAGVQLGLFRHPTSPPGKCEFGRCRGVTEPGSKWASHLMVSDAVAAPRSGSVAVAVLRVRKVGMARVTLRPFWLGQAPTHSR
jgi:hypothetical protein